MARKIEQEYRVVDKGSTELRQATNKIKSELKTVESTSKNVTSALSSSWKSLIGIIGAAGIGGAFISLTKNTLSYMDQLGKLNVRLGINVRQLDKLRQIADLSDVSFKTLSMALQRMTRRLVEASQGTGVAKDAIAELGLSLKDLEGLSPDEQFMLLAKALAGVEDSSKRVALAFKLFDSEGVSVLQMLPDLVKGLEGVSSAITLEKIKRVEDFNNLMTQMKEKFMQYIIDNSDIIIKTFEVIANNLGKIAIAAAAIVAIPLAAWIKKIGIAIGVTFGGLFASFKTLQKMMKVAGAGMGAKMFLDFSTQASRATGIISKLTGALAGLAAVLASPWGIAALAAISAMGGVWLYYRNQVEETTEALKEYKGTAEEIEHAMDVDAVRDKINQLETSIKNSIDIYNTYLKGIPSLPASINNELTRMQNEVGQLNRELSKLQDPRQEHLGLLPIIDYKVTPIPTGLTDEAKAELERAIKMLEDMYVQANIKRMKLNDQAQAAEIASITLVYEKLIERAKGYNELIILLAQNRESEILNIREKYAMLDHNQAEFEYKKRNHQTIKWNQKEKKSMEDYWSWYYTKTTKSYETTFSTIEYLQEKHIKRMLALQQYKADMYLMIENQISSSVADATISWMDRQVQGAKEGAMKVEAIFQNMVSSILREIARLLMQRAIASIVLAVFGAASGAYASGGMNTGAPAHVGAGGTTAYGMKDGGVFNGGRLKKFAKGGTFSSPTIFPMANGAGLMGEAGPEAVMPLKRTSKGELGVIAEDGGGNGGTTQLIVQAMDSQSFVEFARRNPGAFASVLADLTNKGHSGFRQTMKKAVR